MDELNDIFKEMSQKIKIILAIATDEDPYEHNKSLSELSSLPISAIVNDLGFAKIQWIMPGISTNKAKEIYIEKKYKSLIEQSYKIIINNEAYEGWRINNKMQIKEEGNYLRIFIYIKQES